MNYFSLMSGSLVQSDATIDFIKDVRVKQVPQMHSFWFLEPVFIQIRNLWM